jgi:DNA adenine methylase
MTSATRAAPITALAGWFGGNRGNAAAVAAELGELRWCGVPFCGGCPELPHIRAAAGIANDLHRHIINLARVVRDPVLATALDEILCRSLFHPDELAEAQDTCRQYEGAAMSCTPNVAWAAAYFVACWMGRGGHAGKRTEFTQGLSMRWTSSGGDSAVRYRSAVDSLGYWFDALRRWSFSCIDAFEFIENVTDEHGHGLYVDPPWPDAGREYRHAFTRGQHEQLAQRLGELRQTRVVVRYGEHPLIRELYQPPRWTWVENSTRNQRNGEVREALIVNGPSLTAQAGGLFGGGA